MIAANLKVEFEEKFPFISSAGKAFTTEFYTVSRYSELAAGVPICEEGQQCAQLAMLLEGAGRVYKLSPGGREVTLYRVEAGEACVLTASCILNNDSFPAIAVTETPVRAIIIPAASVKKWICLDSQWQQFIFGLLSHRLGSIISVVEEVAFKRLDIRLAERILKLTSAEQTKLEITHAELAADLGSSREVISRLLKDFTDRGMIVTSRGKMELTDPQALLSLSRQ